MRIALVLVAVGCAGSAPRERATGAERETRPLVAGPSNGAAATPLVQHEPPDLRAWSCDAAGNLRGNARAPASSFAPDGHSVVIADELSTAGTAALITCRGGLRGITLHRDDFIDTGVDRSQIEPGLNQMGWYRFTPDGARLIFAVTAHSRRPNPNPPPPYEVSTLVSKFVVVDVEAFGFTEIDTKTVGFNRYDPTNEYIVFWGSDASWRSDFTGAMTRLTPDGAQSYMGPQLSPDGRWVAEALRDVSYVLVPTRDPRTRYTLAPAGKQSMIWPFNVFSPRSSLLAYATVDREQTQSRDFTLFVWDMQAQRRQRVVGLAGAYTVLMKVSPDDRSLLVYSFWVKPQRATRVYCIDLGSGRISVATTHDVEGNLYVDDSFTSAEIGLSEGQGTRFEIACKKWPTVSGSTISAPAAMLQIPRPSP